MKCALVTGGAGFIGSHLVRALLQKGLSVKILDNLSSGDASRVPREASFIEGSVLDVATVSEAMLGADACFHLAAVASIAECSDKLVDSHSTNITGWLRILEYQKNTGSRAKLVYASSAAVYGNCPDLPLAESSRPTPLSAYGADKLSCELHALAARSSFGIDSVGLRFFNVYGPGQDPTSPYSGAIAKFAEAARTGRPITVFGDGEQTRDFIYVGDVVRALILAAEAGPGQGGVYNVCSGQSTTIKNLAETICRLNSMPTNVLHGPARTDEVTHSFGDPLLAKRELGFSSSVSLEQGLSDFLATIMQE